MNVSIEVVEVKDRVEDELAGAMEGGLPCAVNAMSIKDQLVVEMLRPQRQVSLPQTRAESIDRRVLNGVQIAALGSATSLKSDLLLLEKSLGLVGLLEGNESLVVSKLSHNESASLPHGNHRKKKYGEKHAQQGTFIMIHAS